ncbi:MAG: hypothetical protein AAGI36_17040 [Pseudomonadota bacterium]
MRNRCLSAMLIAGLWSTYAAAQSGCDLVCQYDTRAQTLAIGQPPDPLPPFEPVALEYSFSALDMEASNYRGSVVRTVSYEAYKGEALLVAVPEDANVSVVHIRDSLSRLSRAEGNSKRFYLDDNYWADFETGAELEIAPSIDFFMENEAYFDRHAQPKLILSGPFWNEDSYGQRPMGVFKTRADGTISGFLDFDAQHILCIDDDAPMELISIEVLAEGKRTKDASAVGRRADAIVEEQCAAAIQIGPAFFEQKLDGETGLQPGISGLSLRPAKRIVLLRYRAGGGSQSTFIFFEEKISSFDTMVAVGRIAESLSDEPDPIEWAVGLRDEEFLSGLLPGAGRVINDTSVPVGALLVFD